MKYFLLPNSEAAASSIGLGAMALCPLGVEEAIATVRACLDAGITLFETAAGYETSERKLGRGLAERRRDVIVASKSRERSRTGILRHLETSLLRLETEYLDVYQLHYVNKIETLDEIFAADGALAGLLAARESGQIRHLGISGHNVDTMKEAVARFAFDTVQMPYNVVNTLNLPALQRAQRAGALTIGNKPFMAGELFRYGLSAARLVGLLEQKPCPDAIIPGLSSPEQVQALFAPGEEAGDEPTREELFPLHRHCDFCAHAISCPHGAPVSALADAYDILTHYSNKSTHQAVYLSLSKEGATGCPSPCDCYCSAQCSCPLPLGERINQVLQWIPASVF